MSYLCLHLKVHSNIIWSHFKWVLVKELYLYQSVHNEIWYLVHCFMDDLQNQYCTNASTTTEILMTCIEAKALLRFIVDSRPIPMMQNFQSQLLRIYIFLNCCLVILVTFGRSVARNRTDPTNGKHNSQPEKGVFMGYLQGHLSRITRIRL